MCPSHPSLLAISPILFWPIFLLLANLTNLPCVFRHFWSPPRWRYTLAAHAPDKQTRAPEPRAPTQAAPQLDRLPSRPRRQKLAKRDESGKRREHFRTKTESCTVGHRRTVPVFQEFNLAWIEQRTSQTVGQFSKYSCRWGLRSSECVKWRGLASC